jgi:general secretion pathway protein G
MKHITLSSTHRRAGMTLVEVMVVIAILAGLMAVVAVNVTGALQDATVATTKLNILQADQGLQRYAVAHQGRFPSTGDGLETAGAYVTKTTDAWGRDLAYTSPSSLQPDGDYDIVSFGRDGEPGGSSFDGDISNWNANE